MSQNPVTRTADVHVSNAGDRDRLGAAAAAGSSVGRAVRALRSLTVACAFGVALSACEGSNAFEPCDPDGDTPHTACAQTID